MAGPGGRLHSGIGYLTPERKAEIAAAARAVTVSAEAEQAQDIATPSFWTVSRENPASALWRDPVKDSLSAALT